jgi:hypothetical protein
MLLYLLGTHRYNMKYTSAIRRFYRIEQEMMMSKFRLAISRAALIHSDERIRIITYHVDLQS